jgi:hypothetical protein
VLPQFGHLMMLGVSLLALLYRDRADMNNTIDIIRNAITPAIIPKAAATANIVVIIAIIMPDTYSFPLFNKGIKV